MSDAEPTSTPAGPVPLRGTVRSAPRPVHRRPLGTARWRQSRAQPEEIAPTYVCLAADADSSYTVGEVIAVTGGMTDTR
jgi:NAD(P)-dependent dehydrogenase (short-subunit alcohol dehydrogenase family)